MTEPATPAPQDFDEWAKLAATDLPAFETQRKRVIEAAIRQAPTCKQQRLRCLQWKLEQIRNTARTPMVACLRMNRMLWDALAGDGGLLARLHEATCDGAHPGNHRATKAKIIPLERHR
ncbi:MAG: DUF3135 domain-containing protein [Gammaproteobacteria bacterium]|nr:MAG: DUF3135 domain-containing protein [Gammaproteobacteria bacterium]